MKPIDNDFDGKIYITINSEIGTGSAENFTSIRMSVHFFPLVRDPVEINNRTTKEGDLSSTDRVKRSSGSSYVGKDFLF